MDIRRLVSGDEQHVVVASNLFDNPADPDATTRFLADERHHIFVAYEDEQPVGFVTGVEVTHPDKGTEMFLYELAVLEKYRRRGIGRDLVESLKDLAQDRGCYGMWVLTDEENVAARSTYERSGGIAETGQVVVVWQF